MVNDHFSEWHCQKRFIGGGQSRFKGIVFIITKYAVSDLAPKAKSSKNTISFAYIKSR